jgi:hypothetical protein
VLHAESVRLVSVAIDCAVTEARRWRRGLEDIRTPRRQRHVHPSLRRGLGAFVSEPQGLVLPDILLSTEVVVGMRAGRLSSRLLDRHTTAHSNRICSTCSSRWPMDRGLISADQRLLQTNYHVLLLNELLPEPARRVEESSFCEQLHTG